MGDDRRIEGYSYARTFVCTFCKQEFESINSVFSHMNEIHEVSHKNT
jgi:hypothetical protein